MKQVKEFISFDNGFFSTFKENYPDKYNLLFGQGEPTVDANGNIIAYYSEINPSNLDMDLVVTCGERYASPLLIHYEMSKVVSYVCNRYFDGWQRIKAALNAEYSVLNPYDTRKVTTQEKTTSSSNTGTVTDKTGVVAFDETDPTDKTVDSSLNEGSSEGSETIQTTVENTGVNGNTTVANLIANEIEVRRNSFISLVIGDVENQLTLDIY